MNELFFDTVTLTGEQVRTPDGLVRSLADLGLAAGAPLSLYARDLTVAAAPDRNLLLVADRLAAQAPIHFVSPGGPARRVEIWAQHVDGDLDVRCQGSTGAPGAPGKAGTPAIFGFEFLDPGDGPVTKPIRIKVLRKPPGNGGPGGPGGPGGAGGSVRISYVTATKAPRATAPGGAGGPGGPGGAGGTGGIAEGTVVPPGKKGPGGPVGAPGPAGQASVTSLGSKDFLERSAAQSAGMSTVWAAHRLRVAEYHYRVGTAQSLALARAHLVPLVDRPGTGTAQPRARRLLQQLFEGTTYTGEPRDLDVTPDVVFAAQDNATLWDVALGLLGHAQTIAGVAVVQDTFAQQLRNAALQGANTRAAAETRITEAGEHLRTARSSTDVAQGRVNSLDARLAELQKEIAAENEPSTDLFGIMTKVVAVGAAIAGVATGVGAGVAAVAALGQGFALLSKTAGDAKTMYDLVSDVKKKLDSKDMSGFKTSFTDLGDAGKSIFHLGAMVDELSSIGTNHPSPKLRELATVQRERVLLLKEVALHRQMEKEAQLGVLASTAERDAVGANIVLSNGLAAQLDSDVQVKADPVLRTLLTSVHQLLDVLSIAVFRTVRAKEIYLGLDPVGVVRHDLGHLHPDRERMLRPVDQVREITQLVAPRALEIIRWSSLVDQMEGAGGLSRTPVSFWFSTSDTAHLETFRTGRSFGFRIPVEDLLEEDGAQLYETKFDSVTVLLHGASIPGGSGQSVRLRLLGRWSFRRRPDAADPGGRVVEHTLPPHELHLKCAQGEKAVEARPAVPVNPAGQPPQSLWGRGIAAEWELRDADLDLTGLTRIEVGFDTLALAGAGFRSDARQSPRLLRPLLAWPPKPVPPRVATPIPARGWSAYGYAGGVTAVGAGLI